LINYKIDRLLAEAPTTNLQKPAFINHQNRH